jgi:hypothetical protein
LSSNKKVRRGGSVGTKEVTSGRVEASSEPESKVAEEVKRGFEMLAEVLGEIRDSLAVIAAGSSSKTETGVDTGIEGEENIGGAREDEVI